jgi:O-antigen/teichoic acid export membrane protein
LSIDSNSRSFPVYVTEGVSGLKIANMNLMIINAVSGFTVIIVLALLLNHQELAIIMLSLSVMFLLMGFGKETYLIKNTEYQPSTQSIDVQRVYRIGLAILFLLNIVVLLIYWLPPPIPVGSMITILMVFGGFPMLVLYLDFERLGKVLAQSRYGN